MKPNLGLRLAVRMGLTHNGGTVVDFDMATTVAAVELLRGLRTTHADCMPLPAWQLLLRAEKLLNTQIERYLCDEPAPVRLQRSAIVLKHTDYIRDIG